VVSVGVLPDAGTTVTLPATQTYTDGSVVKWDEKTIQGQPEPEHPAPSFVTTASDEAAAAAATTSPSANPAPSAAASTASSDAGSTAGWFGLAAGLIGLAAGVTALARSRSTKTK
jgi:hypothetical protein